MALVISQLEESIARHLEAGDLRAAATDAMRGYGPWNLDNVYTFVYESAVDMSAEGHNQFVKEVSHTDFADLLQARG